MIDITVPVLNEEETLEKQILKIDRFLSEEVSVPEEIRIVIADNGSTDATPEIGKRLAEEIQRVKYLRLEERGVGRALKASWSGTDAQYIGYMDLDLATDLSHLEPALTALLQNRADIVTGSRLAKGATVIGRRPLRKVTSLALNYIIKMIFLTRFTDGMCGFKFLRKDIFNSLLDVGAKSDGWFFATELLITAEYLKYRVFDMPVKWVDDPDSKVKVIKLSIEYLKAMRLLKFNLKQRG